MLSIEVTTKCNLKCLNCFAHDDGAEFSDIGFDCAVDILKEGRELGYTKLSITGGEPLLWKGLLELLNHAIDIGYTYIFLNTNGHLFTPDLCTSLAVFGNKLEISCTINGDEAEHDSVRGAGSYNKAMAGIKTGLKFGLNIYIYTVVTSKNLYSIPQFTKELYNLLPLVKSIVFIQLRGIEDNYYNVAELKLTPVQLIEFVRMVGLLSLAGYKVQILENSLSTVVAEKLELTWLAKSPEISRPGKIVILQDGTVTLNHSSDVNLGKYKKGSLKSILSSDLYIDNTAGESPECKGCNYLSLCRKAGKLRPSDKYHNVGTAESFYCYKVLELV